MKNSCNSKILHNFAIGFFVLFCIVFNFSGCASITNARIKHNLNQNKSIIIFISPDSNVKWRNLDNNSKPFFINDFKAKDFIVAPVDSGVYYVHSFFIQTDKKMYLSFTEEYNSTIGNVRVEKTPEKERVKRTIKRRGKFSEWEETVEEVVKRNSYYKMWYIFNQNEQHAGTITIKPNEVVLIPSVYIDVKLAQQSCERIYDEGLFLFDLIEFVDVVLNFDDFLKNSDDPDEFDYLYWSCPIKSITLNIKTMSKEDFISKVDRDYFPDNTLDKVVIRDFEFGEMFKNATKLETLEDGTERYVIYGNGDEEQTNAEK
jgi:hypothetical protein